MNTFIIVKDDKSINQHKAKKILQACLCPSVFGIALYKNIIDSINVNYITDTQIPMYCNSSNADWKYGIIYVGHPRKNNLLIPAKEYKDYILREMIADIANYIQDNLCTSKLTIGIVSSLNCGLGATIPIEEIIVNAKISCKLAKKYIVNYEGASKSDFRHNYIWIDLFPEIKSAVEHHVTHFETTSETSVDLSIGINIAEMLVGNIFGDKKMKFYVNYVV